MLLDSVVPLLFERLGHLELLALRGTSRELRALASEDHAWADALRRMLDNFELGEDELARPAYPLRARGEQRDRYSFFPIEAERVELAGFVVPPPFYKTPPPLRVTDGVLEDMLHPESDAVEPFHKAVSRTEVYKARPLPLRCELCDVECDSYASFDDHCILFAHKTKLDPSRQFDPRFLDPRFNDPRHSVDDFAALPSMAKFEAMDRYKENMVDWFCMSCPTGPNAAASVLCQRGGWENMEANAAMARDNVKNDAEAFGLSKKEVRAVLRLCTTERAAEVWLKDFVLADFENGLTGYALDVVENGWEMLDSHGSCSHRNFLAGITGLDYG
ncbi:hypothetical protein T484DRAFT_1816540 [Baffinella frigidus]|nr:hypothetical protein T484DRAFT_1816540 [Cryptophyta sp. CCMP2293]